MAESRNLPLVGWREWVSLPGLGPNRLKAKIDTGARTSALHAFGLEIFQRDDASWARFEIHPMQRNDQIAHVVEYPIAEFRTVRSSNGLLSHRPVIQTLVSLGPFFWATEITLADRDAMGFRMLLGRQSIRDRFLVDPGQSFLHTRRRQHSTH